MDSTICLTSDLCVLIHHLKYDQDLLLLPNEFMFPLVINLMSFKQLLLELTLF